MQIQYGSGSRSRLTVGDVVKEVKGMIDKDKESFEYMRRKLWCDVVLLEVHDNPKSIDIADVVLRHFDERFGKGDGE